MKTSVITVTPETAKKMLYKNAVNRPLKEMTVDIYTRQMMAGLWREETGEAIKLATDGSLLDGQHRLYAVVNANVVLKFLLVEGLDKEIFKVLDTGTKRTAGDALYTAGYSNAVRLAAAIRKYYMLKIHQTHHSKAPSNSEIVDIYVQRQKFWNSVDDMAEQWYRKQRLLNTSELVGFYAYFYDINEDMAFEFMEKLATGDNLTSDNPISLLRNKLILSKSAPKMRLNANTRAAFIIKVWNHFRNGTTVKNLIFDSRKEKFPIAQ